MRRSGGRAQLQGCMAGGEHAAEHLADDGIERAKRGSVRRTRIVRNRSRGVRDFGGWQLSLRVP
jgi:hypothetical protein